MKFQVGDKVYFRNPANEVKGAGTIKSELDYASNYFFIIYEKPVADADGRMKHSGLWSERFLTLAKNPNDLLKNIL